MVVVLLAVVGAVFYKRRAVATADRGAQHNRRRRPHHNTEVAHRAGRAGQAAGNLTSSQLPNTNNPAFAGLPGGANEYDLSADDYAEPVFSGMRPADTGDDYSMPDGFTEHGSRV